MKYKCVIEYEYPVDHKPPVRAAIYLHGDTVTTGKIEPAKCGHWIDDYREESLTYGFAYLANCSECGYQINTHKEKGYLNFCPNCGADMRGDEDGLD